MANYFVSYDLNGSNPTHAAMDKHMETVGWTRGRVLETVWYVGTSMTASQVYDHIAKILSSNDLLLVIDAQDAVWNKLLVSDASFEAEWAAHR